MIKRLLFVVLAALVWGSSQSAIFLQDTGGGGSVTLTHHISQSVTAPSHLTSGSFTPSNSSLVVVSVAGIHEDFEPTISSSPTLTWTLQAVYDHALDPYWPNARIWTAPVSTGASTTITIVGMSDENTIYEIYDVTGYDSVGLTHENGSDTGRSGSYSGSMGGTTDSGGVVIGVAVTPGCSTVDDIDAGTGWTERQDVITNSVCLHSQDYAGSKANYELDELDTTGSGRYSVAAIEVTP